MCTLSLTRPPRAHFLPTAVPRAAVPAPRAAVALPQWRAFSDVVEKDVVVPETVDTLEWVLDSPPPLHQFEESPIVVEVAVSHAFGRRLSWSMRHAITLFVATATSRRSHPRALSNPTRPPNPTDAKPPSTPHPVSCPAIVPLATAATSHRHPLTPSLLSQHLM